MNDPTELTRLEAARLKAFVLAQITFAFGSLLAGGLRGLDTAILVLSIGLTGLAYVLETHNGRRRVMTVAAVLYLLGVIDMSFNILASGVLGLKPILAAMAAT